MSPYRSTPQLGSSPAYMPNRRSLEEVSNGFKLSGDSRSAASFSHSHQRPSNEQLGLRSHWSSDQHLLQKGPKQKGEGLPAVISLEAAMDSLAGAPAGPLPAARKSIDLGPAQRQPRNRAPEPLPSKLVLDSRASPSDPPSPSSSPRRPTFFKALNVPRDDDSESSGGDNALANESLRSLLGSQELVSESSSDVSLSGSGSFKSDDSTHRRPAKAVSFIDPRQVRPWPIQCPDISSRGLMISPHSSPPLSTFTRPDLLTCMPVYPRCARK